MDVYAELQKLEDQLGEEELEFEQRLELKDKILELEYKAGIKTKPKDSKFDCIGCGS